MWDVDSGHCAMAFDTHTADVVSVAWNADGQAALSGAGNGVLRVWRVRDLVLPSQAIAATPAREAGGADELQYTNAKVLLVGDSGAGKTGLTGRLARGRFTASDSTSGTWCMQWLLSGLSYEQGIEREIWLWDFGGQADQRIIHQLYMEKAALILLMFDADREDVLPGLRDWQQALRHNVSAEARRFLVAGRTDVGFRFHRERIKRFAEENGHLYFETSAREGRGCHDLKQAILENIPWEYIEKRTSPRIFKTIRDEIVRMRDEGIALVTFKELREVLRQRLSAEISFTDATLETVVSLLDGPGVIKELEFGTYILLRPEWINGYAQAVIRTLRADPRELGCMPLRSIAEGKLIFQTRQPDGEIKEVDRLPEAEERVVLQAMEQTMLKRSLCLRQGDQLVFPSHFGRDRPEVRKLPAAFVSYRFQGFLDDIYATLVVKLAHCGAFPLRDLWRDAADFETLAEHKRLGIKLAREADGRGELKVYCEHGVLPNEQVILASYIHEHLQTKAADIVRLRQYICPHCGTPVSSREVAMERLAEQGETADILCVRCERRVPLWDEMEKRFGSREVQRQVRALRAAEALHLDDRRKAGMLVAEVSARIRSADQKCFEIPGAEDEGIDMEVEFTDQDGNGTGKRMYLQLKAGNSHLRRRKEDGAEVFQIKNPRWVEYWLKQPVPVMLVIGTFPEDDERLRGEAEIRFTDVRWMEIRDWLKRATDNGREKVTQIIFEGERLDLSSVRRWRNRMLGVGTNPRS
jgi:small GTP-binding protein